MFLTTWNCKKQQRAYKVGGLDLEIVAKGTRVHRNWFIHDL